MRITHLVNMAFIIISHKAYGFNSSFLLMELDSFFTLQTIVRILPIILNEYYFNSYLIL